VEIVNSDVAVAFDSLTIDDDNNSHSRGNGNGIPEPGEILELPVTLRNFGTALTAYGVSSDLEPISDNVTVYDASRNYGDLAPGESRTIESPYVVYISSEAQDGDIARMKLNVTDQNNDSWYSVIELQAQAPKFVVGRITIQDSNNRLDPGDSVDLVITVRNQGSVDAAAVTGTLTTDDDYASIEQANCSFGNIVVGDSASNSGTPLRISASTEAFIGGAISFVLHTVTQSGAESAVPFSVTVGSPLGRDPTGPDAYGYYMYDNTDTSYAPHPSYQWLEINPNLGGSGTRLNYGGNTDDKSVMLTLPFDLVYYGDHYGTLIVCINGWVSPDTFRMDSGGNFWSNFFNWPIPDPSGARAQISPFWDDLSFSGSNYGVYTWNDTANHKFYIEWYHMTHRNTSAIETIELVISDPSYHPTLTGDSELLYLYNDVSNTDSGENYASVGIETWDQLSGIQYTHDNENSSGAVNLVDSRAILVTTNTGRGGIRGTVDLQNGGFNQGAKVSVSTGQYRMTPVSGEYWLRNVPPETVTVTAQAQGYFPRLSTASLWSAT
jgi:hypothetical protein